MTTIPTARITSSSVATSLVKPRLWGFDAEQLHDLHWRQQGVVVVRRGHGLPEGQVGRRHLLIEPGEYVLFRPNSGTNSRRSKATSVTTYRIVEHEASSYSEEVECDDEHRLLAVRRRYVPRIRRSTNVALTEDFEIAKNWAEAEDSFTAWMDVRRAQNWRDPDPPPCLEGLCFSSDQAHDWERFFLAMLDQFSASDQGISHDADRDQVILAHPKAYISPRARLKGPAWIGAGRVITDGDVIVGPCILDDVIAEDPSRTQARLESMLMARRDPDPEPGTRAGMELIERTANIAFSAVVLLLTLPLYPLIAMLIWLEDGWPFFFRHTRQTRGGREFACLKFRTMRKDAEKRKHMLWSENASDGPQFHMPVDPRLLRVGRWLRRFHLDELPQFFNVLAGDMNVVGPRPSPDSENQYCPAWREARLSVRPGITGLWQILRTRMPNVDFQEWIRFDMEYVRRRSWRLDAWIVWKTVMKMLRLQH